MKQIILFYLIFSLHPLCRATNYYVSATANNGTGTLANPFGTIQQALNAASQPGDSILVFGGTYFERLNWQFSGSVNQPIVLTNYNQGVVLIDGSAGGTNSTQLDLLQIFDKSFIVISNMHFVNNYRAMAKGVYIKGNCNQVVFTQNKIYQIGWTNNATALPSSSDYANALLVQGSLATSLQHVTISENELFNCITGTGECLTIAGNVDTFSIINNWVHDITNIGIDCSGHWSWSLAPTNVNFSRNGIVRGNVVHHCVSQVATSAGIYVDGAENMLVENNICHHNGAGFSVGCENSGFVITGIILKNNLSYLNLVCGLYFGSGASLSKISNCQLINNTFYRNGTSISYGAEMVLVNNENSTIKQNIFMPKNDSSIAIGVNTGGTINPILSHNLFWRPSGNTGFIIDAFLNPYNSNAIYANPVFVNPISSDFRLQASSSAINAGDLNYLPTPNEKDIDEQPRLNGGRIDCGADEFYSCPSDVTIMTLPFFNASYESQTWIQTVGTLIVHNGGNVKFDADPSNGYIELQPGFMAENGSDFIAETYNGCSLGMPSKPSFNNIVEENYSSLIVYPNPTTGTLTVCNDQVDHMNLVDLVGKKVMVNKIVTGGKSLLDLSQLPNGIYILNLAGFEPTKVIKY